MKNTNRAGRLAALLALACLASCTSSGDGGVSGTDDYLNRGVRVDSADPAGLSYVFLEETSGDATSTCIGVEVRRVIDVFSAAFTVTYDPDLLRFTGFDASTSCVGVVPIVLAPQVDAATTPGRIVVGITRNVAQTTVGSDTCGHLIDLCFEVVGEGEFDMEFDGNLALLKPDGTPVDDLGSNWTPATIIVRQ